MLSEFSFLNYITLWKSNGVKYNYGIDGIGFYFEFFRNNVSNDIISDTINDTIKNELTDFENALYKFILNNGRLNNITVAMEELKKSRITIQRTINSLVRKNLIRRIGSNKTGHWEVIK